MSETRYAVLRLDTGKVLPEFGFDDLADAQDWLEDADDDLFEQRLEQSVRDSTYSPGPAPELAIVDLHNGDLAQFDGDRPAWAWYDGFTGVWRAKLDPAGAA